MKGPHFFEKRKKEMARQEKAKQKADRKAQRKAGKDRGEGEEGEPGEDGDEFSDVAGLDAGVQDHADGGGAGGGQDVGLDDGKKVAVGKPTQTEIVPAPAIPGNQVRGS